MMRSMAVQAGTCVLALTLLMLLELVIVRHLQTHLLAIKGLEQAAHQRYPHGVPSPQELHLAIEGCERTLGESLYPRLHDAVSHLSQTMNAQAHNAQRIRELEGQMAIGNASETAPAASFFSDPSAWLQEWLNRIDRLRQDLSECRALDGSLNREIVAAQKAVILAHRQIDQEILTRDASASLAADAERYAALREAYHGVGNGLLVVEHAGLFALLAGLILRYLFRLLILLEIPGPVRLG
jgi:hypothetical protein